MSGSEAAGAGIDAGIEARGASAFQIVALAVIALGFLLEGMAAQAFGLALPALSRAWRVPHDAFANVTAVGLVGFAAGAAVAGYAGDRLGRRTVLILSVALFALATLVTAAAGDMSQLGLIRFATGLGLGGSIPAAAALMSELAPQRWRSLAIALGFMFMPIGGFLSGLIGARLLPTAGWTGLFLACGGLALAADLLLLAILPESPRFLALRPDRRAELDRLLKRLGQPAPTPEPARRAGWSGLFAPGLKSETASLLVGYFFLLLGMYLVFSWGPSVLTRKGLSLAQASECLSAFALGGVFAGPISGWLIQKLGSRPAIVVLALGTAAAAAWLAWSAAGPTAAFGAMATGIFLLGHLTSGVQTALYALAADVYPAEIRATGLGAAVAAGRIGAVLSSYLGVAALHIGGAPVYFGMIGAAVLVTIVAAACARPGQGRGAPA
jgi:AAHS family 4-hydroxybenzoate transporter-like MFS transporter